MKRQELVTLFTAFQKEHLVSNDPTRRTWDFAFVVISDSADVLLEKKESAHHLSIMVGNGLYNALLKTFGETVSRAGNWITADNGRVFCFKGNMSGAVKITDEDIPCLQTPETVNVGCHTEDYRERTERAVGQMSDYYASFFSADGQKIRGLVPGIKLLIKRDPPTVVKILTVEKRPEHMRTVLHFNVQFSSGITGALYIVVGEDNFHRDDAIHLNELVNLSHPSIEDILWCDKAGVNMHELAK